MIKKITIENYRGIRNKIEINFMANSKRKSEKTGIKKTTKGEVLLTSSLISKNASGKTSFIEGLTFMNSLASGLVYDSIIRFLTRRHNNTTEKISYSISQEKAIDFLVSKEFNNPNKDIRLGCEFIDNNHIVKLEINISNDGIVNEKIILDNKIFSSKKEHLQTFKSNIFNEDLPLKRVKFLNGSGQLSEMFEMLSHDSHSFKFTKKIPKDLLIEWMAIADPKIVKGIWSSKNLLENLILKFNDNNDRKISLTELSSGSKKWLNMFFEIIPALLRKQTFLFFDELERSLHHSLASFILKLFNDPKINKMKSQLFFTTHSPLLVDEMERKDSINYINSMGKVINMGNDLKLREDLKVTKNFLTQELGSHPKMSSAYYFIERLI